MEILGIKSALEIEVAEATKGLTIAIIFFNKVSTRSVYPHKLWKSSEVVEDRRKTELGYYNYYSAHGSPNLTDPDLSSWGSLHLLKGKLNPSVAVS
ncbi:hypothetical protein KQX54_018015 [Cotesia glomerata]|uniref:Uncharacterized protein n=1 Tax=Cotesia glomerata TaxID=32391 RepID=A0AAV7HL12_COTGL|nr:hypothetical protein KQX54_018015 [Cotesia glomerata]